MGGQLFVVSAPSGTGKTTLCRRACRRLPGLVYSVSHTTRPPRPGEIHGRDYFFVDAAVFQQLIDRGDFVEWAEIYNHRYGTSRGWLMSSQAEGLDVILDVDVQGSRQLREKKLPARFIFVLPPSLDALQDRLTARGTESPAQIQSRMGWAEKEICQWIHYDFIVINEDLEEAVRDLEGVIRAERCRPGRRESWIRQQFGKTKTRGVE
jgi:guanylate kinase